MFPSQTHAHTTLCTTRPALLCCCRNIQGARQQSRLLELQSHLERLTREKMTLEAKIGELSQYQNEVVALRNEIAKLQVKLANANDDTTSIQV